MSRRARRTMRRAVSEPTPPIHASVSANPKPSIRLTRICKYSVGSSRASSAKSESVRLLIGYLDLHPEQRRREGLALRVGHERERAAAAQAFVQEEVERAEVGQLEALDAAVHYPAEVLLDAPGRDLAREQRVELFAQRDQPD